MRTEEHKTPAHYGSLTGRVKVRLAKDTDEDREILKSLVIGDGGFRATGLLWESISPYWLFVELDGEVSGCVQVCFSKPLARVEFLCIKESIYHRVKAIMVRDLLVAACATLKTFGAEAVMGSIPFELKNYKKMLKNHGCVVVNAGNLIMKSLTEELY